MIFAMTPLPPTAPVALWLARRGSGSRLPRSLATFGCAQLNQSGCAVKRGTGARVDPEHRL